MRNRPLCVFVLFFAFVIFIFHLWKGEADAGDLPPSFGKERVRITGKLYKKEIKNQKQIYYLKQIQIQNNFQDSKVYKGAVCYMDSLPKDVAEKLGALLCVEGVLSLYETAENDGQFDARSYYESIGVLCKIENAVVLAKGESYDKLSEVLYGVKEKIKARYHAFLKPENAGILSAMLLGDKTGMDPEIKRLYTKNGIAHILAISGLHISFIGMGLYRLLRKAGASLIVSELSGVIFILIYIKMVGVGISSFRAVCMFLMYMAASALSRSYDLLTALCFSALLSILMDSDVIFEAGFLLSYFSVAGLAVANPILQRPLQKKREFKREQRIAYSTSWGPVVSNLWYRLLESLLAGFSIQIFVFPVTLWFYYEFPLHSFLLNIMVVPCVSLIMISGIVGGITGFGPAFLPAELVLDFYEKLCFWGERIPFVHVITGRPEVWKMVAYYLLIVGWLVGDRLWKRKYGHLMFAVPFIAMLLLLLPKPSQSCVDMLSVGQGDCVCIRDGQGTVVLVDGGSSDESKAGQYRLIPFLKYHGIRRVDAVFLSHLHSDHYSAILELLAVSEEEGIKVERLILSSAARQSPDYEKVKEAAQSAQVSLLFMEKGEKAVVGDLSFDCLYPASTETALEGNDSSMVLLARDGDFSMLFTGDISTACEKEVTESLLSLDIEKINVLKVAHHGAQTSTGEEFLKTFDFRVAMISCGRDNQYGHPHKALLERLKSAGCQVHVTSESGQLTLRYE